VKKSISRNHLDLASLDEKFIIVHGANALRDELAKN
jgi:hypothetical protein